LSIALFADGADFNGIVESAKNSNITGFTTNPTLMKQAGITDYESFAKRTIDYLAANRPETSLSLEVFADTLEEMTKQARLIDSWVPDSYRVYIKIPITTTNGTSTGKIIRALSEECIPINITAVMNADQIDGILQTKGKYDNHTIISLFCGRIADTGVDPELVVLHSRHMIDDYKSFHKLNDVKLLWASPREVFNYVQAERSRCDIITMTNTLINKMQNFDRSLYDVSIDTVKMFYTDAVASNYKIG
jgi:transaldolase